MVDCIRVYTDGACKNNGKHNAVAGIGIFFTLGDCRNVSRRIEGKQTNNTAELKAILEVFTILANEIKNGISIFVYSDSQYAIRCATDYGEKISKTGWKKKIPNVELIKKLYSLSSANSNVTFHHVYAHTSNKDIHSISNSHADRLANEALDDSQKNVDNKEKVGCESRIHEFSLAERVEQLENRVKELEFVLNNINRNSIV